MDRLKLIKLLNLTLSENDGEALSATRKINYFIKENNIKWEDILNRKPEIRQPEKDEYAILHMNLMKERSYSQELQNNFKFSKTILKYLLLFVFILIVVIILK